jgi:hypothetical protein
MFSSLKQKAVDFLEPYKQKEPAAYAAAEQAIGAVLITDGFIGIGNPLGGKKRPGIFGTIGGMILGIIFMFIPTIFGSLSGINSMTAVTSATVTSLSSHVTYSTNGGSSTACSLTAQYTVNGKEYTNPSSMSSSNYCALTQGQTININYNPSNPGSWVYGAKTISNILLIFFWVGVIALISSIFTFFIRLASIIFGWKLLKDGRKNATNLPADTNFQTMVSEIKQNFTSSLFGFGGSASPVDSMVEKIIDK